MTATLHPLCASGSVSVEVDEAVHLVGLSANGVRLRYAADPLGRQVDYRSLWQIPRERFDRFVASEVGVVDQTGGCR